MKAQKQALAKSLAELMRLDVSFIEQCLSSKTIDAKDAAQGEPELSPLQLARLRRLRRICASFDIDVIAGSIIVDLLERIAELEAEMEKR